MPCRTRTFWGHFHMIHGYYELGRTYILMVRHFSNALWFISKRQTFSFLLSFEQLRKREFEITSHATDFVVRNIYLQYLENCNNPGFSKISCKYTILRPKPFSNSITYSKIIDIKSWKLWARMILFNLY